MLNRIQQPVIPAGEVCITAFGARPGVDEPQTEAIQAAIDHQAARGGGRVIVPSGRFVTGALTLKSGVELHLSAPDAVLCFTTRINETHYPMVLCHWEGTPCYNYSPLIYALDAHDIALTGSGMLDGQASAQAWWSWHHQTENAWSRDGENPQEHARMALRDMNANGVPIAQRRFGDGHFLRPNFIQLLNCTRVRLSGFTLVRSPMWQVNPVKCQSVTIDGLTLQSYGPNNDGVDPESCDGVLIQHCRFATGDDCISLKSGRDRDGREANLPCRNVVIRHNVFADGHGGVALGSEASGGIRSVIAHHNAFNSPNLTYALRLKTNARRGGVMEDIWLHDCDIKRVGGAAIHGTMLYEDGRAGDFLPQWRNIRIENITAHGGGYGVFLEAFEEVPITGLTLKHIRIDGAERPLRAVNWQAAVVEDVQINGLRFPRPTQVRILGVPAPGLTVSAFTYGLGETISCVFHWQLDGQNAGDGESLTLPAGSEGGVLRLTATCENGESEVSHDYAVLAAAPDLAAMPGAPASLSAMRLRCRGLWNGVPYTPEAPITRRELARLLMPLTWRQSTSVPKDLRADDSDLSAIQAALSCELMALTADGRFDPDGLFTRREMGTLSMQGCGVSYQNASTTMPRCADADQIGAVFGANAARALYYGFQTLDEKQCYHPLAPVTWADAVLTLNRVADFAGL